MPKKKPLSGKTHTVTVIDDPVKPKREPRTIMVGEHDVVVFGPEPQVTATREDAMRLRMADAQANRNPYHDMEQADYLPTHEGTKYHRVLTGWHPVTGEPMEMTVDVYDVIEGFHVRCPAVQHALKKLLNAGTRGKGDTMADLLGAIAAVNRAIQRQRRRERKAAREAAVNEFTQGKKS